MEAAAKCVYSRFKPVEQVRVYGYVPGEEVLHPVWGLYCLQEEGAKCDIVSDIQPGDLKGENELQIMVKMKWNFFGLRAFTL